MYGKPVKLYFSRSYIYKFNNYKPIAYDKTKINILLSNLYLKQSNKLKLLILKIYTK